MKSIQELREKAKRFALVLRVLVDQFKEFLITVICAFATSTWILHNFYPKDLLPQHKISWIDNAYYTWQLIFFQTPLTFVDDWRVAPLFFILPMVGLLVVAEGVVRLGNLLFHYKRYSREWQSMIASTLDNHIVVCGLGNVGVRVVQHLHKRGELVVAIERNHDSRFVAEMQGYNVPVLIGDVRDLGLLERVNIRGAKALIAVTDSDLVNIEAALTAKEVCPDLRIVLRLFDQKLANKVEKVLGINSAFSASALAATVFAQAAISGDIIDSFEFGGSVVNAIGVSVSPKSKLVGKDIEYVRQEFQVTVLMHERQGKLQWNPPPGELISEMDKLLVMTDADGIKRLGEVVHLSSKHNNGNGYTANQFADVDGSGI
jgi:Trk K+ transport system NAD-binding subunit